MCKLCTYCRRRQNISVEEKAAHLLSFVIKDHPFSDGNKRIGSFLCRPSSPCSKTETWAKLSPSAAPKN